MKILSLSVEQERTQGDSTPFLSCVVIRSQDDSCTLEAESSMSTALVDCDASDDVEYKGTGVFMLSAQELSTYVSKMPEGEDVELFCDEETMLYTVSTAAGHISFAAQCATIIDDDMTPHAVNEFKGNSSDFSSFALSQGYRRGSLMANKQDGGEIAGFDPLSGCMMTLDNTGATFVSISMSASESYVPALSPSRDAFSVDAVTIPMFTAAQLSALSTGGEKMSVGVDDNTKHIHFTVNDGEYRVVIFPMNTGGRNTDILSVQTIMNVLQPAWDFRVVSAQLSSTEFFAALQRSSTVSKESVKISINDTEVVVSGEDDSLSTDPFTQTMSCSTQWHGDHTHDISVKTHADSIKKVGTHIPKGSAITFDVAMKEDGSPWALIVHDDDYDHDDPHNFFLIFLF